MVHATSLRLAPVSIGLLLCMILFTAAPVASQESSPGALDPEPGPIASPAASTSPAAPSASELAVDDRLVGTWGIEAFNALGDGLVEPRASSDLAITLLVDGQLEGRTGCGTYVGSFLVDGSAIALDVLLRAPEPCEPAVSDEAVGFTQALNAVSSWQARDAGLELLDEAGRVRISLAPQVAEGPEGEWLVTAFARPNGKLQAAPDDGSMHLVLGPGEQLRGGTGCRLFEGAYQAQSDQILIVPLDISGLPCEGVQHKAERRLLAAFERVVLWQRDGGALRLTDATGAPLVELTAASAPTPTPAPSSSPVS